MSIDFVLDQIEQEIMLLGGDVSKIVIGGFSQGCMLTFGVLLQLHKRFDKPLAGIFGLGGIVPS